MGKWGSANRGGAAFGGEINAHTIGRGIFHALSDAADLVLGTDCPTCGRPRRSASADVLCPRCARLTAREPFFATPRIDPGIPIVAAGPYGGVHRGLVVATKEHQRKDARALCARLLAANLRWLITTGYLPDPRITPWILVPAPTTAAAARARGGDIVTSWCHWAAEAIPGTIQIAPVLESLGKKHDQVGLGAGERRRNLSGTVVVKNATGGGRWAAGRSDGLSLARLRAASRRQEKIILIDDVLTTGSTMTESVLTLRSVGVKPAMGVVICAA